MIESWFLRTGRDLGSRSGPLPCVPGHQSGHIDTHWEVCSVMGSFLECVDCLKILPDNELKLIPAYSLYWFQFCILDKIMRSHLPIIWSTYLNVPLTCMIFQYDSVTLWDVCVLTADLCLVWLTVISLALWQHKGTKEWMFYLVPKRLQGTIHELKPYTVFH